MKRILFYTAVAIVAGFTNTAAGQAFWHDNVRYAIIANGTPYGSYKVAVNYYDTAVVVIPDSVPYNGRNYQVAQVQKFTPHTGSLRHYRKVDYSQSLYSYGACGFVTTDSIAVDTLILPPNFTSLNVSSIRNNGTTVPNKGVHRIFLSPGGQPLSNHYKHNLFGQELVEIDLSAYSDTLLPFWFSGCSSLQKVKLPQTLVKLEKEMFEGDTSLQEMNIPDSLKSIEQNAFGNPLMDYLPLGKNVRTLKHGFCTNWHNLRHIDVSPENPYYMSDEEGVMFSQSRRTLIRYPVGKEEDVYLIPADIDTIGIQSFALKYDKTDGEDYRDNEYQGYSITLYTYQMPQLPCQTEVPLRKVYFHPNIKVIAKEAFAFSSIRQLAGGEEIKEDADFSLSNVEFINTAAFAGSMLESVAFPASLKALGTIDYSYLYFWNAMDEDAIGSPSIPPYPIDDCVLTFSNNWEEIWQNENRHPGIHYTILQGGAVFASCSHLKSVDFSHAGQLSYLGQKTFVNCTQLDSLDLSPCNLIHHIHYHLCCNDSSLRYVHLPYRVDTIDPHAFQNCASLNTFVCPAPVPIVIHSSVFAGVDKKRCTLAVPAASIPLYRQAPVWRDFFNITSNGLIAIAATPNDSTMGVVRGSAGLPSGESTVISAVPHEGYEFVGWSDGSTDNPRTIVATQDSNLVANFQYIEYTIDALTSDSTLGYVTGGGVYHLYDSILLWAHPREYGKFTHWSDGYRFSLRDWVVTGDTTLVAYFEPFGDTTGVFSTLTVLSSDTTRGYVTGGGRYIPSDIATLQAYPRAGYAFKGWDDGDLANPRYVCVFNDSTFTALFRLASDTTDTMVPRYTLKAETDHPSRGYVRGGGRYAAGDAVTLTAVAYDGFRFNGWEVSDSMDTVLVVIMPPHDTAVMAYFIIDETDLDSPLSDTDDLPQNNTPYNLLGQPVDETYHGIVIQNGQKRVQ